MAASTVITSPEALQRIAETYRERISSAKEGHKQDAVSRYLRFCSKHALAIFPKEAI